jgi:hypothetical protein
MACRRHGPQAWWPPEAGPAGRRRLRRRIKTLINPVGEAGLASIHRVNPDVALLRLPRLVMIRTVFRGRGFPAADLFGGLSGSSAGDRCWRAAAGAVAYGDRVGAGQAAAAGGPQAAWNRLIHPVSRCQPSGRCMVMWLRPWRAMRAATLISWSRYGLWRGRPRPGSRRRGSGYGRWRPGSAMQRWRGNARRAGARGAAGQVRKTLARR